MFLRITKIALWLIAVAIGFIVFFAPNVDITVPEDKVIAAVNDALPMTIEKSGATVVVKAATVDFLETNVVHITADFDISGMGISGDANIDATSGLRYRNGEFFLTDVSLDNIKGSMDQQSEGKIADVKAIGSGLMGSLREKLSEHNVDAGPAMDRMQAAAVERFKPIILDALNSKLQTTPVYSLNGQSLKHSLAAAALDDIRFFADSAVVSLDPSQLVLRIIGVIAFLGLALIMAIGMIFGTRSGAVV